MGNAAGVKRNFDALEKRRLSALELLNQGDLNQSEVAHRFHVCRQTVSRWMTEYRQGGEEALHKAGRAGRKAAVSEQDRARLEELLLAGPEPVHLRSLSVYAGHREHGVARRCTAGFR